MKDLFNNFQKKQVNVRFSFKDDPERTYEGRVIRNGESFSIYGGRAIVIRPIRDEDGSQDWFGTVEINEHGDYNTHLVDEIEVFEEVTQ